MQHFFIRTRTYELLTEAFLKNLIQKYHYDPKDFDLLKKAAYDVLGCIRHGEAIEIIISDDNTYADIAYTLGPHVDALLSRYEKEHLILMQLMTEHIAADLLMEGYNQFQTYLDGFTITSIHFWGGQEQYPLTGMAEIVPQLKHISLSLTPDYYLIPSKSILCRAMLVREKKGSADCASSIACASCPRFGTDQCEFQASTDSTN